MKISLITTAGEPGAREIQCPFDLRTWWISRGVVVFNHPEGKTATFSVHPAIFSFLLFLLGLALFLLLLGRLLGVRRWLCRPGRGGILLWASRWRSLAIRFGRPGRRPIGAGGGRLSFAYVLVAGESLFQTRSSNGLYAYSNVERPNGLPPGRSGGRLERLLNISGRAVPTLHPQK